MKHIEKHIFLILAVLLVVLSALCYTLLERGAPGATDEQYVSLVRDRVRAELAVSNEELKQVGEQVRLAQDYSFSGLQQPTRYPYFIFKNGELLFWSDYQFVPNYAAVASVNRPQLVDFEQGRYLVSRLNVRKGADVLAIYSLVNIYRQYKTSSSYLQSGYNADLFRLDPQQINGVRSPTAYQNIYEPKAGFLFSVVPPRVDAFRNDSTPVNTVILGSLAVLFLGLYVGLQIVRLRRSRHYGAGFALLALYFVILRGVMLYFGVPFLFFETELFNPKFYASSFLAPSLGDMLLNCVVVAMLLLYLVLYYFRSHLYNRLIHFPQWSRWALALVCVLLSYGTFYACFVELNNIYVKSQFTLDITLNIRFNGLKAASLLVFVSISIIYFLALNLLGSLYIRFVDTPWLGVLAIGIASVLAAIGFYTVDAFNDPIWIVNGLFFLLLYLSRFPRTLYAFEYRTSIYLFLSALVCACMTTYVVYQQEIRKDVAQKNEFGMRLLAENDDFGEFLLQKSAEVISRDPDIQRFMDDTLLAPGRIQQHVKTAILDRYFNKYDTEVLSFDANGYPIDRALAGESLQQLREQFGQERYKTQYNNLFFVNEVGSTFIKQYVQFIEIRKSQTNATIGYIVLRLRLWGGLPKNVYPELLVDNPLFELPEAQDYSYAIYGRPPLGQTHPNRLIYSDGPYNYDRKLPLNALSNASLYNGGLVINEYKHVGLRGKNGRTVVVSSLNYPYQSMLSNFSFLFLVLVITVLVVIAVYAVKYGLSRFSINLSTRIQILLNLAFFLPLLLVVLIILSVISSNYIANQEATYISNTRNIAANFLTYLDEYAQERRSKAAMEEELKKIAHDAGVDINLFDTKGRLFSSSRPLIYEGGHLSKFINPEAYVHLIENKENQVLLDESLGSKPYRTAYTNIRSYDGRQLGVLSIPYFYARPDLDRQVSEVIASALNVFMFLFIIFMALSYVASRKLTRPLKILTQKIRRTNLDKLNEPLEWKSDDEIGLLIGEYNRMLVKLQDSKLALSQSEKQSAWREMAKQVVHEIKNPLTPMKLTLQQLQRTLPAGEGDTRARRILQRTFDSLLEQIDNLSDIATSFSEFAKMPMPKNEVFEISSVLNKAADLYADDTRISLTRQVQTGPIMVRGDRHMMGRILTNLIINGIQSVPAGRRPTVELKLFTSDDLVNIEVHDNGAGIPEAIRNKIFLPNFSTKQGGSGLGLAIAKRGIDHAGGSIWFETTEDVGTSFFISLPLTDPATISSARTLTGDFTPVITKKNGSAPIGINPLGTNPN
ncbi:sensor histidine kinase [Rudanella lutea]|uniref:sensor histidine kinase n=1 Tax=Rudanella lutea TaxID=451374 RepID=UPI00036BE8EC|nr:HAMP domain-containing sensor histidine kinase [Rudanella lutea]